MKKIKELAGGIKDNVTPSLQYEYTKLKSDVQEFNKDFAIVDAIVTSNARNLNGVTNIKKDDFLYYLIKTTEKTDYKEPTKKGDKKSKLQETTFVKNVMIHDIFNKIYEPEHVTVKLLLWKNFPNLMNKIKQNVTKIMLVRYDLFKILLTNPSNDKALLKLQDYLVKFDYIDIINYFAIPLFNFKIGVPVNLNKNYLTVFAAVGYIIKLMIYCHIFSYRKFTKKEFVKNFKTYIDKNSVEVEGDGENDKITDNALVKWFEHSFDQMNEKEGYDIYTLYDKYIGNVKKSITTKKDTIVLDLTIGKTPSNEAYKLYKSTKPKQRRISLEKYDTKKNPEKEKPLSYEEEVKLDNIRLDNIQKRIQSFVTLYNKRTVTTTKEDSNILNIPN